MERYKPSPAASTRMRSAGVRTVVTCVIWSGEVGEVGEVGAAGAALCVCGWCKKDEVNMRAPHGKWSVVYGSHVGADRGESRTTSSSAGHRAAPSPPARGVKSLRVARVRW